MDYRSRVRIVEDNSFAASRSIDNRLECDIYLLITGVRF